MSIVQYLCDSLDFLTIASCSARFLRGLCLRKLAKHPLSVMVARASIVKIYPKEQEMNLRSFDEKETLRRRGVYETKIVWVIQLDMSKLASKKAS